MTLRPPLHRSALLLGLTGVLLAVLPALASAQAAFASRANTGMCIDLPNGSLAEGTQLVLYQCHGGENQLLTLQSDGHIVVKGGQTDSRGYQMCLDYYPSAGNNGDAVRIWPCHPINGPDSQRWTRLASGEFRSNSGRCIDIQGGISNAGRNGNPLVLWDCPDPGNYNTRRWTETRGSSASGSASNTEEASLAQRQSAVISRVISAVSSLNGPVSSGQRAQAQEAAGRVLSSFLDLKSEYRTLHDQRLAVMRGLPGAESRLQQYEQGHARVDASLKAIEAVISVIRNSNVVETPRGRQSVVYQIRQQVEILQDGNARQRAAAGI